MFFVAVAIWRLVHGEQAVSRREEWKERKDDDKTSLTFHTGVHYENWSRTFSCRPGVYCSPRNATEMQEVRCFSKGKSDRCSLIVVDIRQAFRYAHAHHLPVRLVGRGHSPSDIACTDGLMISTARLKLLQVRERERSGRGV